MRFGPLGDLVVGDGLRALARVALARLTPESGDAGILSGNSASTSRLQQGRGDALTPARSIRPGKPTIERLALRKPARWECLSLAPSW